MSLLLLFVSCSEPDFLRFETGGRETGFCDFRGSVPAAGWSVDLIPDGCRYMVVGASNTEDLRMIFDAAAFADLAAGTPFTTSYTLPHDQVRLQLESGCNVNAECSASGQPPLIEYTFIATEGQVDVVGTPDAKGGGATVDVTFTDVWFEDEFGQQTKLNSLAWVGVALTL